MNLSHIAHVGDPSLVNVIYRLLHLLPIGFKLEPSTISNMVSEQGLGWRHHTWFRLCHPSQISSSPQFISPSASRLHVRGIVRLYPTSLT